MQSGIIYFMLLNGLVLQSLEKRNFFYIHKATPARGSIFNANDKSDFSLCITEHLRIDQPSHHRGAWRAKNKQSDAVDLDPFLPENMMDYVGYLRNCESTILKPFILRRYMQRIKPSYDLEKYYGSNFKRLLSEYYFSALAKFGEWHIFSGCTGIHKSHDLNSAWMNREESDEFFREILAAYYPSFLHSPAPLIFAYYPPEVTNQPDVTVDQWTLFFKQPKIKIEPRSHLFNKPQKAKK